MNVKLESYTQDALNLLLRTKNTRLKFSSDPATWNQEAKDEHLDYMKDTIKSSWEFVNYTFNITGVTRAFTHQLVRTRTGSYAQESQRTVDVSGNPVLKPLSVRDSVATEVQWDTAQEVMMGMYSQMLKNGVPPQDARGILPTNITTGIMAQFNLRTLHEMAKTRLCTRTQGEYQDVFRQMRARVIEVHPWVSEFGFLEVHCVATGTCAFPRYGKTDCPVYLPEMDNTAVRKAAQERFWEVRHVATPKAKNGKSM